MVQNKHIMQSFLCTCFKCAAPEFYSKVPGFVILVSNKYYPTCAKKVRIAFFSSSMDCGDAIVDHAPNVNDQRGKVQRHG